MMKYFIDTYRVDDNCKLVKAFPTMKYDFPYESLVIQTAQEISCDQGEMIFITRLGETDPFIIFFHSGIIHDPKIIQYFMNDIMTRRQYE